MSTDAHDPAGLLSDAEVAAMAQRDADAFDADGEPSWGMFYTDVMAHTARDRRALLRHCAALVRERDAATASQARQANWIRRLGSKIDALRAEVEVVTRLAAERWDRWQRADTRVAALEAALREAIYTVSHHKTSIGALDNVYCPQVYVTTVDRWRAALAAAPAVEPPEPLPDVGGLAWVEVGEHDEMMVLKAWDTRSRAWRYATRYEAETLIANREPAPAMEPGAPGGTTMTPTEREVVFGTTAVEPGAEPRAETATTSISTYAPTDDEPNAETAAAIEDARAGRVEPMPTDDEGRVIFEERAEACEWELVDKHRGMVSYQTSCGIPTGYFADPYTTGEKCVHCGKRIVIVKGAGG